MLFLLCFSLIFLFSTESVYNYILRNLIKSENCRYFIRIFITLIGQSFFILVFNRRINKIIAYPIFLISIFLILCFFSFAFLKILQLFNLKINYQYCSYIIFFSIIIYMFYGFINSKNIKITEYKIQIEKKVKYRIAFISDIHIGSLSMNQKNLTKIVNKLNSLENIDYIMFGGDIIEKQFNNSLDIKEYSEILKKINPRKGIFGVLGNHEYYNSEPYKIADYLTKNCGIEILKDEYKILENNLLLIGREDQTKNIYGEKRKKINDITKNLDVKNYFSLVLDHNPKKFDEIVENDLDLQLSGHTHNGQFFPINLIVKLLYEKSYGLLNKKSKILITSSGITAWGVPIKVCSKAEIVIVNVN